MPILRKALNFELIPQFSYIFGYIVGKFTAPEGFHDYDRPYARGSGVAQSLQPSLVIFIQDVELDLAHLPVIGIDNILKYRQIIVEGEAGIFNLTGFYCLIEEIQNAHLLYYVPHLSFERGEAKKSMVSTS